jgi:hypothetical protein
MATTVRVSLNSLDAIFKTSQKMFWARSKIGCGVFLAALF